MRKEQDISKRIHDYLNQIEDEKKINDPSTTRLIDLFQAKIEELRWVLRGK